MSKLGKYLDRWIWGIECICRVGFLLRIFQQTCSIRMRYFSRMRGSGMMKNIVASSRRMWPKWTRWQVATAAQTGVRLWSRSMSTSPSPSLHSLHFFSSNPFLQMSKSDVKEASYWNITSDGRTSPTQTPPCNWSKKLFLKEFDSKFQMLLLT